MKFSVFPHFSRIFSAPLFLVGTKMLLWIALITFIGFNAYQRAALRPYWKSNLGVLTQPNTLTAHLILAQTYWQAGNWPRVETELRIAQTLFPSSGESSSQPNNVLGTNASPLDLLHQWAQEPARVEKELAFWQTVMKEKPDYRDAYLVASALSYELNKPEDAKQYLDQATTLDPNSPVVSRLTQFLSSK